MKSMRLDYRHELPEASRAMSQLERVVEASGLDPKMRELIKLRASQINGCAYCVDMHTKDAEAMGEDAQRLHLVAVWREAPVFSPGNGRHSPGPRRSRSCPRPGHPTTSTLRWRASSTRPSRSL